MDRFEQFLERYFLDDNSVVYSQIDGDTKRPLTEEFFQRYGDDRQRIWRDRKISSAAFWSYENSGMCTGAWLASLCSRMRLSDDEHFRKMARAAFSGIRHIYEVGKAFDVGFFPKIWGNELSLQTSTDQVLYALYSMHQYMPFADQDEKALINEMIPAMADFWYRRNYILDYYHIKNMVWPPLRFPSFLMLAFHYTGQEKYRSEALRILDENITKIPENSRRKSGSLSYEADALTMDVMNLEILLKHAPVPEKYHDILRNGMRIKWHEAKQTLTEDGFTRAFVPCDPQTGIMLDQPEKFGPRMGWSTMVVRGGLMASGTLPELTAETVAAAENVLQKLSPEQMYYFHPDDRHLLPEERHESETHFLSGDALANRLWADALLNEVKSGIAGSVSY